MRYIFAIERQALVKTYEYDATTRHFLHPQYRVKKNGGAVVVHGCMSALRAPPHRCGAPSDQNLEYVYMYDAKFISRVDGVVSVK